MEKQEKNLITEDDFRESFYDRPASERVYLTRGDATNLICRAYNIYKLSRANAGFGSNCCRVSDGWWPSVTIFHDSLGKCGSKVIDLNGEADLQRVSDLLDKLADTDREETDTEFMDRMFEGCNPADFDRIVSIIKKGGSDE